MQDLMICPECGGLVGASEVTDQGRPCQCYAGPSGSRQSTLPDIRIGEEDISGKTETDRKICCACGKDVTHAKRARDSLGYWCYDCHKADRKKNQPVGVKCEQCGKVVKESSLQEFGSKRMCHTCYKFHTEEAARARKFRARAPTKAYDQDEKRRLIMLCGLLVLLAVIAVILHILHIP